MKHETAPSSTTPRHAASDRSPDEQSRPADETRRGDAKKKQRSPLLVWGSIGAAAVLLLAVGVPVGMWAGERATVNGYAEEDAEALAAAVDGAREASDLFDSAAEIAAAHLDTVAIPVKTAAETHPAEFGQEHVDALVERIGVLQQAIVPPTPAPEEAVAEPDGTENSGDAAQNAEPASFNTAGDSAATDENALTDDTSAAEETAALDVWAYTVEPLADSPDDVAAALSAHYLSVAGSERFQARAAVSQEVARFDQLSTLFTASTEGLREAVDAVDASIRDLVAAASDTGTATIDTLQYSSDESIAAMREAIDAFAATTEIELPAPWEQRTVEQPTALANVTAAIDTYVETTAAARASHTENTPRPSTGRGGGGGGTQVYACYRWGPYGAYMGLCLR